MGEVITIMQGQAILILTIQPMPHDSSLGQGHLACPMHMHCLPTTRIIIITSFFVHGIGWCKERGRKRKREVIERKRVGIETERERRGERGLYPEPEKKGF